MDGNSWGVAGDLPVTSSSCLPVRVPGLGSSRAGREPGGQLPAGQLVSLQGKEEGRERLRATGAELSLVDLDRVPIRTNQL